MWIKVIIVCFIFVWISEPINKRVYSKVRKKWLAYAISLVIDFCILLALYGIAYLLGFNIYTK